MYSTSATIWGMADKNSFRDRFPYWKELFRRNPVTVATTSLYGTLAAFSLLKTEFLPDRWQHKQLIAFIPTWTWRTWLIGCLVLIIGGLLEGSYQAAKRRDQQIESLRRLQKASMPDFRVEVKRVFEDCVTPNLNWQMTALFLKVLVVNVSDTPSSITSVFVKLRGNEDAKYFAQDTFKTTSIQWTKQMPVHLVGYEEEVSQSIPQSEDAVNLLGLITKQNLVKGKHEVGWLLFEGLPLPQLHSGEVVPLDLYVTDAFGAIHPPTATDCRLEVGRAKEGR
jgi:hypothetical protein